MSIVEWVTVRLEGGPFDGDCGDMPACPPCPCGGNHVMLEITDETDGRLVGRYYQAKVGDLVLHWCPLE